MDKQRLNNILDDIGKLYINIENINSYNNISEDLINNLNADDKDKNKILSLNTASKKEMQELIINLQDIEKALIDIYTD